MNLLESLKRYTTVVADTDRIAVRDRGRIFNLLVRCGGQILGLLIGFGCQILLVEFLRRRVYDLVNFYAESRKLEQYAQARVAKKAN